MRKRIFILSGCIAVVLGACTPDYSLPPPHNPKGVAGIFQYDCSGFVDYALSNTAPDALDTLRDFGRTKRPQAKTYEELLASIAPQATRDRWAPVARVADLLPGDLVAWIATSNKEDYLGNVNSGHVMIVDALRTQIVLGRIL